MREDWRFRLEEIRSIVAAWLGIDKEEVSVFTILPLDMPETGRCVEDLLVSIGTMYDLHPSVLIDEGVSTVGGLCACIERIGH